MIHLYAFARGLDDLPDVAGVGGGALALVDVDEAVAVVSPTGEAAAADDPVRHGLVVEAVAERAVSVLPARFGERFADTRSLRDSTSRLVPDLARRLDRLEGRVEIGVRVVAGDGRDGAVPVAPADGAGYMHARLRELNERDALVRGLHADLEHESVDCAVPPGVASHLLHEGAYLVARDAVDDFRARVERFASAHPQLTLVCTGPWAPYSFSGAAG